LSTILRHTLDDTAITKEFHERILTIDDTCDSAEVNKIPVANQHGYLDRSWLQDYNSFKIRDLQTVVNDYVTDLDDIEYVHLINLGSRISVQLTSPDEIDESLPYRKALIYRFVVKSNSDDYTITWTSNKPNYNIVWNTYSESAPELDANGTYFEFISTDNGLTWYGTSSNMTDYDIHDYYNKTTSDDRFVHYTDTELLVPDMTNMAGKYLVNNGLESYWADYKKLIYVSYPSTDVTSITVPQEYIQDATITDIFRNGVLLTESDDYAKNNSTGVITFTDIIRAGEKISVFTETSVKAHSYSAFNNLELTNSTADTPDTSDNSDKIATTAYVNNKLAEYNLSSTLASLDSPAFNGIPTAPTAAAGTNTNQIATTEFVNTAITNNTTTTTTAINNAINNLKDNAPSDLDTLGKIATAIDNDPNFSINIHNELDNKLNTSISEVGEGNGVANVSEENGSLIITKVNFSLADHDHGDAYLAATPNVGSGVTPIYTDESGQLVASSSTVGDSQTPVYLQDGVLTAVSASISLANHNHDDLYTPLSENVGSNIKHIYSNENGQLVESDATVGDNLTPVYLDNGELKVISGSVSLSNHDHDNKYAPLSLNAGSNIKHIYSDEEGHFLESDATVGDELTPVYLNNGEITAISGSVSLSNHNHDDRYTPLASDVGSGINPIYTDEFGGLIRSTATVGDDVTPVYLNNGEITAFPVSVSLSTHDHDDRYVAIRTNVGSNTTPVFLNGNGVITASSASIGNNSVPVYMDSGSITAFTESIGNETTPVFIDSGIITAFYADIGDNDTPVYIDDGSIVSTGKHFSDYLPLTGGEVTGTLTLTNETLPLVIGESLAEDHLEITSSSIQAKTGDVESDISINPDGGAVTFGNSETGTVVINNGTIHADNIVGEITGVIDRANKDSNGDIIVNTYAHLDSPDLVGTPTAPTAESGDNSNTIATTAYVDNAISELIDSSPNALNTLNELASALNNDSNFATNVFNAINNKADKFSDDIRLIDTTPNTGLDETFTGERYDNNIRGYAVDSTNLIGTIRFRSNANADGDIVKFIRMYVGDSSISVNSRYDHETETTTYYTETQTPDLSDNSTKIATTEFVKSVTNNILPDQTNNANKYLTTDGTTASWASVDALPSQSGNAGKYLVTNGTTASWEDITNTEVKISSIHYPSEGETTITLTGSDVLPSDVSKYAIAVYRDGIYLNPTIDYNFNHNTNVLTFTVPFEIDEIVTVIFSYISSDTQASLDLDIDEYEAGDNITFVNNPTTGKVTINAAASTATDSTKLGGVEASNYALLSSPELTGTPTAPTAAAGTSTTQIATTAFVTGAISDLVSGAPSTLDTLKEIADVLNDSSTGIGAINTALEGKLNTNITTTGSGNAITAITDSNGNITATKGSTFSLSTHNHTGTYLPLNNGISEGNYIAFKGSHEEGVAPSATIEKYITFRDANSHNMGSLYFTYNTDMSSSMALRAYKTTIANDAGKQGQLGIGWTADNKVYTVAPTPATSDNSTQIATTAFVKAQGYTTASGHNHDSAYTAKAESKGSATQGIYTDSNGAIQAMTYSLNKTVPSDAIFTDTNTKVNVTLGTTTKAYLLGTSTTPTSTAAGVTAISDTGVYLDTTAGMLTATTFKGNLSGNLTATAPTAPTATTTTNNTQIATTAYVNNRFANSTENVKALTSAATIAINPTESSLFTLTLSRNATINISTISNGYYTTNGAVITLFMPAHNYTISWGSSISWVEGSAPDLSEGYNIITFASPNGGTTWYGSALSVSS